MSPPPDSSATAPLPVDNPASWPTLGVRGIACVETAETASVARLAPERLRGSAFGLLATVQSLGNLAASVIAGLLWTLVSPAAAFAYAAFWMLVAAAAFTTFRVSRT
ncbi:MAG: hypothetical protein ACR2KV_08075 [Solirubrobacteraceae bacterium]